ncbi:MAG: WbuC family cupin fold metalloprotein [Bryobacteraceae bacterium]
MTAYPEAARLHPPSRIIVIKMSANRVQLMTPALFDRVLHQARQSPRQRMNFNFHATLDENPSRLLNVLLRGTYITPHRHSDPPKSESFVVLEGRIAVFIFDDTGRVAERHALGRGDAALGIDIAPGIWHTAAALSDHAVCFEVKPGPYVQAVDKEFAPWAPREGDPRCAAYLETLLCDFK